MADSLILSAIAIVPRTWREEVERRRAISKADPVADTLEYCAGEVEQQLRTIERAAPSMTVDQYARAHNVTAQTVRGWCRSEQIPGARQTPKGWLIPADAKHARRIA